MGKEGRRRAGGGRRGGRGRREGRSLKIVKTIAKSLHPHDTLQLFRELNSTWTLRDLYTFLAATKFPPCSSQPEFVFCQVQEFSIKQ